MGMKSFAVFTFISEIY